MRADMTEAACSANRQAALRASRLIASGMEPSLLAEVELDRLMYCGACQWSGLGVDERDVVLKALAAEVMKKIEQVEGMNWERGEEDVKIERRRKAVARWNEAHKERKVSYMKEFRLFKSIMKLGR